MDLVRLLYLHIYPQSIMTVTCKVASKCDVCLVFLAVSVKHIQLGGSAKTGIVALGRKASICRVRFVATLSPSSTSHGFPLTQMFHKLGICQRRRLQLELVEKQTTRGSIVCRFESEHHPFFC